MSDSSKPSYIIRVKFGTMKNPDGNDQELAAPAQQRCRGNRGFIFSARLTTIGGTLITRGLTGVAA